MDKQERDDLKKAYKKEKDHRVRARILAVNIVCNEGLKINEVATYLMQCPDWIGIWIQHFNTDGLDGLRDLPRSGRPPKIPLQEMNKIMKHVSQTPTTPATLHQQIFQKTKVKLHLTYVRELMRKYGLSSKRATPIHINAAGKEFVEKWQRNLNRRISCLEAQGFTFVVEDESFFIRDRTEGCRYWTPVGTPVIVPYVGSHDTVTAYGSLTADGRQFFRTYSDARKDLQKINCMHSGPCLDFWLFVNRIRPSTFIEREIRKSSLGHPRYRSCARSWQWWSSRTETCKRRFPRARQHLPGRSHSWRWK